MNIMKELLELFIFLVSSDKIHILWFLFDIIIENNKIYYKFIPIEIFLSLKNCFLHSEQSERMYWYYNTVYFFSVCYQYFG